MPDVNSTVIINIDISQVDAKAKVAELTKALQDLKDQQTILTATGQKNSQAFRDNAEAIKKTAAESKAYTAIANSSEGSIIQLRAQLALMTKQYIALSGAERDNTKAGIALRDSMKETSDKLKVLEAGYGSTNRNVGNYEEAIRAALGEQGKFSTGIIEVAQKANSLSEAFGATGVAAGFLGAGMLIVGGAVVAVGAYLEQFTPFVNTLKQDMAGLWQAFIVLGDAVRTNNFTDLGNRMHQASDEARKLTADLQLLQAEIAGNVVTTAAYEAKISELTLAMRNRRNTPAQEADYFAQIQSLADKNYINQKDLADRSFANAVKQATNGKKLAEEEINTFNDIRNASASTAAFILEDEGKINEGTAKQIAAAQEMDIAAERYKIEAKQRAQNREDTQNLRTEAKAKELQQHLDEINLDRQKSELATAQSILTVRTKEYNDISNDIDKREKLWRKYGQDTAQLELERLTRIRTLRDKFTQEDLKIISTNTRASSLSNIKSGASTFGSGSVAQQSANLQNVFDLQDIDREIEEVKKRVTNGEKGLTEVLQSYINKRKAIQAAGAAADLKTDQDLAVNKTNQQKQAADEMLKYDTDLLKQQEAVNQQRLELNDKLAASYEGVFNTIADIAGKTSIVGKVAFTIEKALAIAQIAINAEKAKSAATAAYYENLAWDATAGPFGIGLAVADTAIYGAQIGQITASEIASIATIAAQTIVTDISGHAQGGPISGPGSGTSDSIPAMLSNGEFVMTAKATQMFGPLLHNMNTSAGGRGFATGGLAGSFVPTLTNQAISDNAITRSISGINMKPVVYVEDINYGQDKYAVNVEAGNF